MHADGTVHAHASTCTFRVLQHWHDMHTFLPLVLLFSRRLSSALCTRGRVTTFPPLPRRRRASRTNTSACTGRRVAPRSLLSRRLACPFAIGLPLAPVFPGAFEPRRASSSLPPLARASAAGLASPSASGGRAAAAATGGRRAGGGHGALLVKRSQHLPRDERRMVEALRPNYFHLLAQPLGLLSVSRSTKQRS